MTVTNSISVLLIAVGLGMDAFAVAIAAGVVIKKLSFRHVFRISFHFGLFQFFMPILGWLAGRTISDYIVDYDHWIAFFLLAFIGGKMIKDSFALEGEGTYSDPTRGLTLVFLSIATSIDALAVGLSLAFLNVKIFYPSIVIGIVALMMSMIGIIFGEKLGKIAGKKIGIVGGCVLVCIGLKIFVEHFLK